MMMAMPKAPTTIATGLATPKERFNSPGKPKMPAPMMQLTTSPVSAHRPIDLLSAIP
jgi:hypothetical protein